MVDKALSQHDDFTRTVFAELRRKSARVNEMMESRARAVQQPVEGKELLSHHKPAARPLQNES
jgi:hypothetical protein